MEDIIMSFGEEIDLDHGMSKAILVSKLHRLENARERVDEIAQFFETRVSFSKIWQNEAPLSEEVVIWVSLAIANITPVQFCFSTPLICGN